MVQVNFSIYQYKSWMTNGKTPDVTRYSNRRVHETQLINLIDCIHCPRELTSSTPFVRASHWVGFRHCVPKTKPNLGHELFAVRDWLL